MGSEVFQCAVARIAPGIAITNPDDTFEKILWADSCMLPTRAALGSKLIRCANLLSPNVMHSQLSWVRHQVGKLTVACDAVV